MNEDVEKIVNDLKSRGVFDEFRKECLSDLDTTTTFVNLRQKVDAIVGTFLKEQTWNPSVNRNQLRDALRKKLIDSDAISNSKGKLVAQVVEGKANTYMLSRIDKYVQDYLGIKVEEPLIRIEDNVISWPQSETVEVKKEESVKWKQDNFLDVNTKTEAKSAVPSLSPSTVSSHSLSPPTPEPITDGESEDSVIPAPSPTSLISGENSKSPQHYFDESTSKSPTKTKNDIWNQLSKEGKQSADEPKPEPLNWGPNTTPPPERPFAHLGSSSAEKTTATETAEELASTIKSEPKSPELPSSSSSVPLTSSKSKEESREEISEVEESKGKSDPIVSDMLSDVSSAHTSDLTDYSDRMSISTIDEVEDFRKDIDEGKSKSQEKTFTDIKVKQEKDLVPKVNDEVKNIKVEDTSEVGKDQVMKDLTKDQPKDHTKDLPKNQSKEPSTKDQTKPDLAKDQVPEKKREPMKTQPEPKKRKSPEMDIDPWDVEMPELKPIVPKPVEPKPVEIKPVEKPKFEIIKSTPEAPVFDIRARGKEAVCLTPKKPDEWSPITPKEVTTTVKTEKPSEMNKSKFVIPKIKREPKSRDPSPPVKPPSPPPVSTPSSSRSTNEDSRAKRSSRDSSKKKSDLSSSQRYDEADLYKPRPSIPGSRRHRTSK